MSSGVVDDQLVQITRATQCLVDELRQLNQHLSDIHEVLQDG